MKYACHWKLIITEAYAESTNQIYEHLFLW